MNTFKHIIRKFNIKQLKDYQEKTLCIKVIKEHIFELKIK